MLENIAVQHILFLDIETVPQFPSFDLLPERSKKLYTKKTELKRKEIPVAEYYNSAGIYAEFGKIVCICCGFFDVKDGKKKLRIKSFSGDNEKQILEDFSQLLARHFNSKEHNLCAHNGKEFDFPFIARRMLVHGLMLPALLDIGAKKPWEVNLLDTMELWRFGDHKNFTSLDLLASVFNIPTPKDDIDGSMIYRIYWEEKNLERIVKYCCKDVLTIAQLFLKYKREPLLTEKEILYVDTLPIK